MSYYIYYNPSLGNALVAISAHPLANVNDDISVEFKDEPMPDLSKYTWAEGSLSFELDPSKEIKSRFCTQTEFMRKFTMMERLAIRGMERDGDLIIIDAMALMNGTKDGVNLDDPDVLLTLQYLASKSVITPERIQEILA